MTSPMFFPLVIVSIAVGVVALRLILTARWSRAKAEVVSLGQPYSVTFDSRVDATMLPAIRFSTAAGAVVTLEDKKLRLGPAIVGEHIDILYSPHDPNKVVAVSFLKRFRIEIVALGFGGLMLAAIALS